MQQSDKLSSRKKFLLWSAALISSVTLLRFFTGSKKSPGKNDGDNNKTVKMLTRDGKLVEIDKSLLASSGNKISNEELQKWIKK